MEIWLANDFRRYRKYLENPLGAPHWTRWFNLHSRQHIEETYPTGISFLLNQDGTRPIYLQKHWDDVPGCQVFPRSEIQQYFSTAKGPNRYFACTLAWQLALAIMERFDRIEMWGYELNDSIKRKRVERPCVFYWIQQARDRGIDVQYQQEIADIPFVTGDPDTYIEKLYGYSTKPEPDWNLDTEEFTL